MENGKKCETHGFVASVMWWATLVVAVFTVPAFGLVIAALFPFDGIMKVVTFVLGCWLLTYLGIVMMRNPAMSKPLRFWKK